MSRGNNENLNNLENEGEEKRKKPQAKDINPQKKFTLIYKCYKHVKKYGLNNKMYF